MSSEDAIVNTFCKLLKDFLNDIYMSYPDPSLILLQQAATAMILTNPKGVVQNFKKYTEKYNEAILAKDEQLFIDGRLEEDVEGGEYSFLSDELKKIAIIWKKPETSTKTKSSIWKYLQLLVKLSQKVT